MSQINLSNKHSDGFIYLWLNLINGKLYLGSHFGKDDDGYIGSGVLFKKAVKKYGISNFRRFILEYVKNSTHKELLSIETWYLKRLDVMRSGKYYNLTESSGGGFRTESSKIKQSLAMTGKKQSKETVKKRTDKVCKQNHPMWLGYYKTPKGIFITQKEAAIENKCSYRTVSLRCKSKIDGWDILNETRK